MPTTREEKLNILQETVNTFGRKEWFRDAVIYDKHPNTDLPTLEIKCNYIPLFERKEIKSFVLRFNLTERFIVVDSTGNPVQ